MICTFLGHGGAPPDVLSQLIRSHPNACFYLGTHGNFDAYAAMVLHALKQENRAFGVTASWRIIL